MAPYAHALLQDHSRNPVRLGSLTPLPQCHIKPYIRIDEAMCSAVHVWCCVQDVMDHYYQFSWKQLMQLSATIGNQM